MADYSFNDSRWQPMLQYRYAFHEGDDPDTSADEAFDPLFPGFRDWGTWWQGEIAGEYFLSNSNLKTHMLQLRLHPSEKVSTGLLFFDYRLHQPGDAVEEAHDRTQAFEYAMVYATFSISK